MDNGVQSLKVDEDIVSGDKDDGVQSLPEDDWDEGFQSLLEDELDNGVQSLEADKDIIFGNKDGGVQSLSVDDLDEGVQCLPWMRTAYLVSKSPVLMDMRPWFLFLTSNQVQVSRERNGEPRPVNLAIDLNGVISLCEL